MYIKRALACTHADFVSCLLIDHTEAFFVSNQVTHSTYYPMRWPETPSCPTMSSQRGQSSHPKRAARCCATLGGCHIRTCKGSGCYAFRLCPVLVRNRKSRLAAQLGRIAVQPWAPVALLEMSVDLTGQVHLHENEGIHRRIATRSDCRQVGRWDISNGLL